METPEGRSNLLPPGVVLGVDWGRKRVGLAVCDSSQTMVFPLKIMPCSGLQGDLSGLRRAATENGVKSIVVGWPTHANGDPGQNCPEILRWVQAVCSPLGLPVFMADERYSSVLADEVLRESGRRASQRKGLLDSMAAHEFLQDVLTGGCRVWPLGQNPPQLDMLEPKHRPGRY